MVLGMVDAVLAQAGLDFANVDGIAYGAGPGSFTGLRIACGVVQGLALARAVGVVGIGTLLALAEASAEEGDAAAQGVIACLDARMGEVYHAAYRSDGAGGEHHWREVSPPGLYAPGSVPLAPGAGWIGCGSGFAAHGEALSARLGAGLAQMRPQAMPSARAVLRLARPRFEAGFAQDPEHALPLYLRDKVALKTSERQ
jgi:tRNA threonylcarbamoyladenosine biosynthesis protein TsaB